MKALYVCLFTLAGSFVVNATPSLIGSNATVNYLYPDASTVLATQNVAVTSGVEISCAGSFGGSGVCPIFAEPATVDIGATSITISEAAGSAYTASTFNGMQFSSLNFGDGSTITGFTLTDTLAGLTAADISFTGNSIEYNAEGLSFANSPYSITLDLTTTTSGTPEPASIGLFGIASLTIGLWKLRSRRAKA